MDPKYIQGTPEYAEWIASQLPPGYDLSLLGIPGLGDSGSAASDKLGHVTRVSVPSSSEAVLSHGALTADGETIYTVSEGHIDKVSLNEGNEVTTIVSPPLNDFGQPEPLTFRYCALAKDGGVICVGDFGGRLSIYSTDDGSLLHQVQTNKNGVPITGLLVLPNGEQVVVTSNESSVRLFDVETGSQVWAQEDAHDGWCETVCHLDGKIYSGDGDGSLKVWSAEDGSLLQETTLNGVNITHMLAIPDGRILVGAEEGKLVIISADDLSITSRHLVADSSDVRWMSVSEDLSTLFTSACDHRLKIWRLEDFKLLRDCPDQTGYVSYHALLPSEDRLVGITNNTVDIHNICPWSTFLERPLFTGFDDISNFSSEIETLQGRISSLRGMEKQAKELIKVISDEPLAEDHAALERLTVENAESAAKEVSEDVTKTVSTISAAIETCQEKQEFVSAACDLSGEKLVELKEAMYAKDSEVYTAAARDISSSLEKAEAEYNKMLPSLSEKLLLLEEAPEKRARAQNGAIIHASKVAARAERLKDWPHKDKLPPLEPGCKWHLFLSHYQLNGGDQCMALKQSLLEVFPDIKIWYDQDNAPTEQGMKEGVSCSETYLLFLTKSVLTRPFVQLEVRTALSYGKPIVLVHETDSRHGAASIGEMIGEAPEDARVIFLDSVSIPHYREREYRKVMLTKILRNSALPVPDEMNFSKVDDDTDAPETSKPAASAVPPAAMSPPQPQATHGPDARPAAPGVNNAVNAAFSHDLRQLEKTVGNLKQELVALKAATAAPASAPSDAKGSPAMQAQDPSQAPPPTGNKELEALKGEFSQLQALREEVAELQALRAEVTQVAKLANLKQDIDELRAAIKGDDNSSKGSLLPLPAAAAGSKLLASDLEMRLKEQSEEHAKKLQVLQKQLEEEKAAREELAKAMKDMAASARAANAPTQANSSACIIM